MTKASAHRRHALRAFLHGEAAGGIVLIAAAALAMIAANWPATAHGYDALLHAQIGPTLAPALGPMTVHLWINDGLMALFFLLVGLEIKREFVGGRLASADRRRLPFIAAVAGMAVPALVFLLVAGDTPGLQPGWAIPAATDIAFAIGVLALLGSRVPSSLKLLLTTVAIVDDMGAVAIIAIAYTDSIRVLALAGAGLALLVLYVLNRRQVMALWPYLLVGAALWLFVLQSGVHATIAGVMTAMLVPIRRDAAGSPLHRLEHALHPWSAFAIVPLFGFANAGVSLTGVGLETFAQPLVLGIALGLFLGKQTGILAAIWGADRLGIARRPAGVSWGQLYGMALIAGIGFTMSLFIGGLAFADPAQMDAVKIGVLAGSIASALAGAAVLVIAGRRAHAAR
ncbi:sodium:proton antiporter [Sphingomonas melonis TY]|jgi:Na+:H+ antiporter, NhaA family|uniref:Na(+)/H(+) antiporter NhaA n=1 Tax=Sphingomonas melonis TY TaxID=621456 RepID=A0A175Y441_9SPHN|nr:MULTISPECIES: Na+/H+ antiporter NhaA [Sphingomonas]AOW22626.1 Na(+)/H(+) antiporter NhaA [Sphingomonas melonis TY]ATI56023.1 Na+/H+ antiporter NhaA [Sphingomonas melonis]KZB95453.1 sodium:proton antiporter [Sphingomonas melonis TY]MBI0530645.1 Na+/H+ antiporter NhaA [Sphingomonas sp. TX0522]MBX8845269.1 Na+/H+ antiporter NhaA [Sphingomonas melonis]